MCICLSLSFDLWAVMLCPCSTRYVFSTSYTNSIKEKTEIEQITDEECQVFLISALEQFLVVWCVGECLADFFRSFRIVFLNFVRLVVELFDLEGLEDGKCCL